MRIVPFTILPNCTEQLGAFFKATMSWWRETSEEVEQVVSAEAEAQPLCLIKTCIAASGYFAFGESIEMSDSFAMTCKVASGRWRSDTKEVLAYESR